MKEFLFLPPSHGSVNEKLYERKALPFDCIRKLNFCPSPCGIGSHADFLKILINQSPQCAIFVLDNARIHCTNEIEELIKNSGRTFIYSSPYSPDLNPIEFVFGWIKNTIKIHNYSIYNVVDVIENQLNKLDFNIMYGFISICQKRWKDNNYI